MDKLTCIRLKPWQPLVAGKPVGPAYRFEKRGNAVVLEVDLPHLGTTAFRAEWINPVVNIYPRGIHLFREGEPTPAATFCWYIKHQLIEEIRINDLTLRGSGLAYVLINIALSDIYSQGGSLRNLHSTTPLAHDDSTLAIIGLLARFGIDCYKDADLEKVLSTFWDAQNPLSVMAVAGRPDLLYLHYSPTSWRSWANSTFKVFMLNSQNDRAQLERLRDDRKELARLIRAQQAYLSLSMHVDPGKAETLEAYTSVLPELPF